MKKWDLLCSSSNNNNNHNKDMEISFYTIWGLKITMSQSSHLCLFSFHLCKRIKPLKKYGIKDHVREYIGIFPSPTSLRVQLQGSGYLSIPFVFSPHSAVICLLPADLYRPFLSSVYTKQYLRGINL